MLLPKVPKEMTETVEVEVFPEHLPFVVLLAPVRELSRSIGDTPSVEVFDVLH